MGVQFCIADHYDVMEQLDRDVHENIELSRTEVDLALDLIGDVPESVFLPCFGTGRHIAHLLDRGVKQIVGVDLSPKCVEKALKTASVGPAVRLCAGDLLEWDSAQAFDAVLLLGNSWADLVEPEPLRQMTLKIVQSMKPSGVFVMDYIGENYMDRCKNATYSCWESELDGVRVRDRRKPIFDPVTRIMRIDVEIAHWLDENQIVWKGFYQKRIFSDAETGEFFEKLGMGLARAGIARDLNPYCAKNEETLGMLSRSNWWTGRIRGKLGKK